MRAQDCIHVHDEADLITRSTCTQAGQGRNMGGLGLGGQMGPMGAALGLGTSPGRSNAMNSLHAANMSTAFNQPSNNLLAMFNKGGMNGMGTQGFGGHTAGEQHACALGCRCSTASQCPQRF